MNNINKVKKICNAINNKFTFNTVCFTGHRSQKLPWGFNEKDKRFLLTKEDTKKVIEKCVLNGKTHFISGMALGFDIMCAELVLDFKKKHPNLILECAIPFAQQEKHWKLEQQLRYQKIIKQADKIRCIYDHYTRFCTHERNKYMVNASSLVIALFNGQDGGTKQTLNYAKQQGKEIILITPY